MELTRGTGMYILTGFTHMRFQHSAIRCGGTGVTVLIGGIGTMVGDGTGVGDGVLIMLGDIIRRTGDIGAVGMADTLGDITTTTIIGMVRRGEVSADLIMEDVA